MKLTAKLSHAKNPTYKRKVVSRSGHGGAAGAKKSNLREESKGAVMATEYAASPLQRLLRETES